ncbi:cyclase family protein [Legionella jamestowniensis]|uniref:Cyclase n=1 Tax=Legionella jamestowniensis TaxID=455 RepID=A0A0W0UTM6_9GAMM|nr:cyclase family protein [Legionella jamestowniensis]KTD11221.1 metal-dependent hydrolase [Legionella jamestowniensis]OCH98081.1 cyclase [Legionella jamestowniensis]SFL70384.1 Kynurenine formamidase [Legionella jamestowniensis DSM 19215]
MTFAYTLIDLTHILTAEIPCWEGDCGFQHYNVHDYEAGLETSFRVQRLKMDAGIGTHMDAPAHCISGGKTIADFDLNALLSPCVLIDVSNVANANYTVKPNDILEFEASHGEIMKGSFVIIRTGWDNYWENPVKYRNHYCFPSLEESTAKLLLQRGITGLGIDTLSPDRPDTGYPVHRTFLGAGKYIVENIANASSLPPLGSYILVLPIKIKEGTEAPVRLVALLKKNVAV